MTTNPQSVQIRVLVASTGVCYSISMHPAELTVANIRRHLAGAVPPQDQILLLGPPYKVPKDSTLRSDEVLAALRLGDQEDDPTLGNSEITGSEGNVRRRWILNTTEGSGAKRLFLFSKQALSEAAPDPPPCVLEPMNLTLPTEPDPTPPIFPQQDNSASTGSLAPSSPLHQALEVYERRFMLNLCRGRALADGADMRLSSCRTCVSELAVMARALRAAVSNLSDHRNGAARTRSEFTSSFQAKTASHTALLHQFETHLQSLASVSLHPAIVAVARSSGRLMETLLDTVPVERERTWANQCQTSHQRLLTLFSELDAGFSQLGTPSSREEEARQDLDAEDDIRKLCCEVEDSGTDIRDKQSQRLTKLTSDHREVVRVIMGAVSGDGKDMEKTGNSAQEAFTTLEQMSKESVDILPLMESDDIVLKTLMVKVAGAKTNAMKRMRLRLRQVSIAQSAIQRVLSRVAVLRDALTQQCENMVHLEHVAELPASYRSFLSEIRRRRAYGGAVTSSSTAMIERLAAMRSDEVKAREKFLRGPGRHLMPAFFEIFVPTLATPPPLFTPQLPAMVEMDTLPDVGLGETRNSEREETEGVFSLTSNENDAQIQQNVSSEPAAISSASSLSDVQTHQMTEKSNIESGHEVPQRNSQDTSGDIPEGQSNEKSAEQRQPIIVSADENSANDVIMGATSIPEDDEKLAEADAERKTLAYENAVLRQAIEAMGGKSPRKYIDEAQSRDRESAENERSLQLKTQEEIQVAENRTSALESEITELRKQLLSSESELQKAKRALLVARNKPTAEGELSDKISHSSFDVGDVGLFMPTGRGSGGKRTYLAFHSNCPHRYLSTDSIKGTPDYVLGRIVYQEELVAGPVGTDSNPYGLHIGTKFWVLTVEVLKIP